MMRLVLLLASACAAADADIARPPKASGAQLHADPSVWLVEDAWSRDTCAHARGRLPAHEAAWEPCIGQTSQFNSKRCTMLPVRGDVVLEEAVSKLGAMWAMDVSRLLRDGLPIIRYLPGAPPVGVHGDLSGDGVVPNATIVLYLTDSEPEPTSGQTFFPDLGVTVSARQGAALSFANVDATGAPEPTSRHGVSAVSMRAPQDRLVVQIPILLAPGTGAAYAWPEHVSGGKHAAHMGFMGAMLLVVLGYYLWQQITEQPMAYDPAIDGRI